MLPYKTELNPGFAPDLEHIYIDQNVFDTPVAVRARELWPDRITVLGPGVVPLQELEGKLSADEFARSKRLLHLTEFKGEFFKRCPGARPGLTCCNYFVLNLGLQCNFNCSYCYLQSFINTPLMKIYTNLDKALAELAAIGETQSDQKIRIGTGEVIDSLSLDPLTLYSRELIRFFKNYPNWRLEFKTKSALVDQFLDEQHAGNVVVSWSVNPAPIVDAEEHGTARLNERLAAARRCRDKGFAVAFHIDPMIWHPEWEDNYRELVSQIATLFSADEVPYVSVGALRFQPEQRHMMRERFGMSNVMRGEMFAGPDGKLRYDQNLRQQMFQAMDRWFKNHDPKWKSFLCMESPETWLKGFGSAPKSRPGLDDLFDHSLTRKVQSAHENFIESR